MDAAGGTEAGRIVGKAVKGKRDAFVVMRPWLVFAGGVLPGSDLQRAEEAFYKEGLPELAVEFFSNVFRDGIPDIAHKNDLGGVGSAVGGAAKRRIFPRWPILGTNHHESRLADRPERRWRS